MISSEKRYQIFLSSTYSDLHEERRSVIQVLMEMSCIPAGMELFPAADEEQFNFIKKVIDDSDYYVLIIGARYGSVDDRGVSYTEKEYDYAVQKGMHVLAFIRKNIQDVPLSKADTERSAVERLNAFRDRVSKGRLVKFWSEASELPGLVPLSLMKAMTTYPAVGWVRGNVVTSAQSATTIQNLLEENEKLRQRIDTSPNLELSVESLASFDSVFKVQGTIKPSGSSVAIDWAARHTWRKIFSYISPYLLESPNDMMVRYRLAELLYPNKIPTGADLKIRDQDFQTIKVQLMALQLISTSYTKTVKGGMALFWSLTDKGRNQMFLDCSIKE